MLIAKFAVTVMLAVHVRVGARGGQHAVAPVRRSGSRRSAPPSPRVPSAPWFTVCGVVPVIVPFAPGRVGQGVGVDREVGA